MRTITNLFVGLALSSCLAAGCTANDDENLVPEMDEDALVDGPVEFKDGVLSEGDKNYPLDWGMLEDWGVVFPNTRTYVIDIFSSDYDNFSGDGTSRIGIYFNSPSLTSFEMGTYKIKGDWVFG